MTTNNDNNNKYRFSCLLNGQEECPHGPVVDGRMGLGDFWGVTDGSLTLKMHAEWGNFGLVYQLLPYCVAHTMKTAGYQFLTMWSLPWKQSAGYQLLPYCVALCIKTAGYVVLTMETAGYQFLTMWSLPWKQQVISCSLTMWSLPWKQSAGYQLLPYYVFLTMETAGYQLLPYYVFLTMESSWFISYFLTMCSLPWKPLVYQLLPYYVAFTMETVGLSVPSLLSGHHHENVQPVSWLHLRRAFSFSNSVQVLLSCTHKEHVQFHNTCKALESVSGWFTGDKLFKCIIHQGIIISSVDKFNFCIGLYTVENVTCRCLNKGLILKGLSLSGWSWGTFF